MTAWLDKRDREPTGKARVIYIQADSGFTSIDCHHRPPPPRGYRLAHRIGGVNYICRQRQWPPQPSKQRNWADVNIHKDNQVEDDDGLPDVTGDQSMQLMSSVPNEEKRLMAPRRRGLVSHFQKQRTPMQFLASFSGPDAAMLAKTMRPRFSHEPPP